MKYLTPLVAVLGLAVLITVSIRVAAWLENAWLTILDAEVRRMP
jgi:hypothetical protein